MGIKKKKINGKEYEVLEHAEVPGYRTAFHIIIGLAVVYFLYIFSHAVH